MGVERTSSGGRPAYRAAVPGARAFPYTPGDKASRAAAKASAERSGRVLAANRARRSRKRSA